MPVTATPLPCRPRCVTRDQIRRWLRDYPPGLIRGTGVYNSLLDGVEFSDDDVDQGISMTVDLYNGLTPFTNMNAEMIPRILVYYGAAAHLIRSEAFHQMRNQSEAQDGDVQPLGIDSKVQIYTAVADALDAKWKELARALKTQWNAERFFGGYGSGYQNTSRALYG